MEIRVLRYFLMTAREQNITRASELLHITQPTLSRQLSALEDELGVVLFTRGNKKITLTEEGILLKRRAMEILDLEEKTIEELQAKDPLVEGSVTIGCGEYGAVRTLARICSTYRSRYPKVQIRLHTATADVIYDMMKQGLVDIGLFMEPINTDELEYIRFPDKEPWVISMRPDDPLASKDWISKEDILDLPLILPERLSVQSELANWFGKDYDRLNVAFTGNLATNSAIMAQHGLAYPITIEGTMQFWNKDTLVYRKLYPEMTSQTIIAWRRNIPYSSAALKFIDEINAFQALQAST